MDLAYELHAFTATLDLYAEGHLRERGVTFTQFKILSVLSQEAPTTGRSLSTWLRLTPAAVSKNVTQLKNRGLILDLREPGMGNVQQLQLSPEGGRILGDLVLQLQGPLESVCEACGVDAQELAHTLFRLNEEAMTQFSSPA